MRAKLDVNGRELPGLVSAIIAHRHRLRIKGGGRLESRHKLKELQSRRVTVVRMASGLRQAGRRTAHFKCVDRRHEDRMIGRHKARLLRVAFAAQLHLHALRRHAFSACVAIRCLALCVVRDMI